MSEFGDIPKSDRRSRLGWLVRREADEARLLGEAYDEISEENERTKTIIDEELANWPDGPGEEVWGDFDWVEELDELVEDDADSAGVRETISITNLPRVIREYFAEMGFVLDAGSVDEGFIQKLGYDVCADPVMLQYVIERAQEMKKTEQIRTEDIIDAASVIETEGLQAEATTESAFRLRQLGANEDEVLALYDTHPAKLRSYSRLLEAPILSDYIESIRERVGRGETIPLDQLIGEAVSISFMNSKLQALLDSGDAGANELIYKRTQTNKRFLAAYKEMQLMRSAADALPIDIPDPRDDFDEPTG